MVVAQINGKQPSCWTLPTALWLAVAYSQTLPCLSHGRPKDVHHELPDTRLASEVHKYLCVSNYIFCVVRSKYVYVQGVPGNCATLLSSREPERNFWLT